MSFSPHARLRKAGFTLIWVSILLTVASLIFVSMLPGQGAGDINQKNINNTKKLEYVENAMRSFMAFHGRRPCPADGQYAVNTANFGVEAAIAGTCTVTGGMMGPDAGTSNVIAGTIPTKALGIPDDYAFDDFGRRFTYVVDLRATSKSTCGTLMNYPTNNGKGGIKIESATGVTPEVDDVMYSYISHGLAGYGAFPEQGSIVANRVNSGSSDGDMQTNAGVDAHFPGASAFTYSTSNFTNVFVQKDRVAPTSTDTGFDDIVWYRNDIKNTCCLGPICTPIGIRLDEYTTPAKGAISVAVGDIDGDGYPDIVIGNAWDAYVWVIWGGPGKYPIASPLLLSGLSHATTGFRISTGTYGSPGTVAVGDINHDGYADIVISDWGSNVFVIFGQPRASWTQSNYTLDAVAGTGLIDGTHGFMITDDYSTTERFGRYGLAVGDINNDGYKDLVISGATGSPNGVVTAGKVYVVYGKTGTAAAWAPATTSVTTGVANYTANVGSSTGLMVGQKITSNIAAINGATITGINSSTQITYSVKVVAPQSGTLSVNSTTLSSFLDGVHGFELDGTVAGAYVGVGNSLAIGDVNGDGYGDIVTTNDGEEADAAGNWGQAYVLFGKASPELPATTVITTSGSTAASVASDTNLVTCQVITSANTAAGTTIHSAAARRRARRPAPRPVSYFLPMPRRETVLRRWR